MILCWRGRKWLKNNCSNSLNLSLQPRKLRNCACSTLVWVTSSWRMLERPLIVLTAWFNSDEVFSANSSSSSSRLNTLWRGGNCEEVSRMGAESVLMAWRRGSRLLWPCQTESYRQSMSWWLLRMRFLRDVCARAHPVIPWLIHKDELLREWVSYSPYLTLIVFRCNGFTWWCLDFGIWYSSWSMC